jgi:hypothetical protein
MKLGRWRWPTMRGAAWIGSIGRRQGASGPLFYYDLIKSMVHHEV